VSNWASSPASKIRFATAPTGSAKTIFLNSPAEKKRQPERHMERVELRLAELRDHFRVVVDRSGNEVRKKGHEQRVIGRRINRAA